MFIRMSRSGGTITAAAAGVNDNIFGKYHGYVMETLPKKLSVSKNLGLIYQLIETRIHVTQGILKRIYLDR